MFIRYNYRIIDFLAYLQQKIPVFKTCIVSNIYYKLYRNKSLDAACLRPLLFQNTRNKIPILENALKNVCNKLFYLSKLCPVSLLSYDHVYYISVNALISY